LPVPHVSPGLRDVGCLQRRVSGYITAEFPTNPLPCCR